MGNQLSTEARTEFDGVQGDQDLSPPHPSHPPYTPQSPDIVFSSQVPPSATRVPPSPTHQQYNQPDIKMSSSPPPQQPAAMSPKQGAKFEIPESPDYRQQTSTPVPVPSKSKKRRRGNRPSLISQPRLLESDNAVDNETSVNGSSPGAEEGSASVRRKRKRNERRRKKALLQASPDLGNLEMPNDPIQSLEPDEVQETQQDLIVGLHTTNTTTTESTPPSASLTKKRKILGSAGKDRKRQKRDSNGTLGVNSATSFSGLAESLYAGRKKNRKALEVIEDDSMDTGAPRVSPDNHGQKSISRDSSVSDLNTNSNDPNLGEAIHPSTESNEMETGSPDSSSSDADLSPDRMQQDNQNHVVTNQDSNDEEPESDKRSDGRGEQRSIGNGDLVPQTMPNADITNDEYPSDVEDIHNNSSLGLRPKQSSARKRFVKPTFFEREAEGNANSSANQASSSSATGKKQPKISAMLQLQGNGVDTPTLKKTPSKRRAPPKETQPHELVTGQFSDFELRNITQAVERWRDDHNLTQSEVNDLIQGNPREVKSQEFWARVVATCPNRRRQKVINQCRRKFHNFVARGAWTPEQHEELKKMWEIHGSKYAIIGKLINRHPEDVRDRIRNYVVCGESRRVDPWTYEEEEKLRSIISDAVKVIRERRQEGHILSNESDEDLIDWQRVSELMERTRSRLQCIQKWKLMQKQVQDGVGSIDGGENLPIAQIIQNARDEAETISSRDRYNIVKAIRTFGVNADGRIPWAKVRKQLSGRWRRPTIILVWYRLKHSVPDHIIMTVPEIIKQLSVRYHETKELDFPSGEDYDQNAEYTEIERKVNKILSKTQRGPRTPATVVKADDDDDDDDDDDNDDDNDVDGDDDKEIADYNKESGADEDSQEEDSESNEEDQQIEKNEDKAENEKSKGSIQSRDESDDESASSDQSEDEELSEQPRTEHASDDSSDLENNVEEDENLQRESSVQSPIANIRSRKASKSQKRYSLSSKATTSRTPISGKRKIATKMAKPNNNEQGLDVEEELSSDTNASEVESIPAH
ncbi:hypothetical protein F5Y00DRAFT_67664 [Daldinia vernicosa]|uniref:uncharacterized protein n=1 Tax=Daldinia vernicosa TaxID=114800 RepID=UPI0020080055|nr:uncharacterized protein F5Y00DRAFT_67664 [Daldinia vernicosa]KAI0849504.1 hypothetical protein F5Y00DRAFT_67664 [Daldinia vernicosa]